MTKPPIIDADDTPSLFRRALDLTALRNSILQTVLLSEQASAAYADMTTPERELYATASAAFIAADDMRDAFAAIGIDRETLAKLGDLL